MAEQRPFYLFTVLVLSAGGIPKGYDEGGFSASITLPSFKNDFNLNASHWKSDAGGLANRTANITSFGVLGAAFGALIAFAVNDRLGRLRSYQFAIMVWASGILMQVFSSGIFGFLLFSRIWGGLGAGALTVISPLFLAEIAPAKSRGMIVSTYMVMLLSFLSLGFFANYGVNAHMPPTRAQYRVVQALPLIPMGLAAIGSLFLTDSPRWLASQGRLQDSLATLARLRGLDQGDPALLSEQELITTDIQQAARLKGYSTRNIIREMFTIPSLRSRFLLSIMMQTVAQWTGGNGITYYISQIFQYAGVSGSSNSLLSSGAYGLVKLLFTAIFTWALIDRFGRRTCFIAGLLLQCISHVYMAIYFGTGLLGRPAASNAAIASVFIYAVGWSIGLCTIPYLYATELFPTRTRSFSYAANMGLHWFFQFAVVRVTPVMLTSLNIWGAYVFWALVCGIGLVVLALWAPETSGIPMEKMHELFERHWWKCGHAKPLSIYTSENSLPQRKDGSAVHAEESA